MENIKIIPGNIAVDDRGSVRFVNDFNFAGVKRFYQVQNHRAGFIRAWHGHMHEAKYIYVAKGAALIGAMPFDKQTTNAGEFKKTLAADKPEILYIPPRYYNGFKTLTDDAILMFFSTSTLKESANDDIRMPWNTIPNFWNEEQR